MNSDPRHFEPARRPHPSRPLTDVRLVSTSQFDDEVPPTPHTHISIDSASPELPQLLHDVADLRRLLLQNIFVGQSHTKTTDDMWASLREARQTGAQSLLQCRRQEAEIARLESEVASCRTALQRAASEQTSLQQRGVGREHEVTQLQARLSTCEDINRDLVVCTARLSESIFDLAGAGDVEAETERVRVRYDRQEMERAHLQRLVARLQEEKSALEHQVQQWAGSHRQLRAQSVSLIADKDRTIDTLQAVIVENGLSVPQVRS